MKLSASNLLRFFQILIAEAASNLLRLSLVPNAQIWGCFSDSLLAFKFAKIISDCSRGSRFRFAENDAKNSDPDLSGVFTETFWDGLFSRCGS